MSIHLAYIRFRYSPLDSVGRFDKCREFGAAHCSTTSGKNHNVILRHSEGSTSVAAKKIDHISVTKECRLNLDMERDTSSDSPFPLLYAGTGTIR